MNKEKEKWEKAMKIIFVGFIVMFMAWYLGEKLAEFHKHSEIKKVEFRK